MDYEQTPDFEEITPEEFNKRFRKTPKPKKKKQTKKIQAIPDFNPDEFDEIDPSPEQSQEMQTTEENLERRQMMEYQEKRTPTPESSVETDFELIKMEARMALKKELMPAKDQAGIERNIAIELEEEYPEPFTADMVKGNFGDIERGLVFGHISVINAMKTIGQSKKFSFVNACRFNKAQMDALVNISRAKNGFSAILLKTDKHVSEGVVQHVQKALIEKQQKKWGLF